MNDKQTNNHTHRTTWAITPITTGYDKTGNARFDFAIIRDPKDNYPIVMIHTDTFLPSRKQILEENAGTEIYELLTNGYAIEVVAEFHLTRETRQTLEANGVIK